MTLWDRLEDFISNKQHHPLYAHKFNAMVIRQNLSTSLRLLHESGFCSKVWSTAISFINVLSSLQGITSFFYYVSQTISNHLYLSFIVISMFFVFILFSFYIIQGLCHQKSGRWKGSKKTMKVVTKEEAKYRFQVTDNAPIDKAIGS